MGSPGKYAPCHKELTHAIPSRPQLRPNLAPGPPGLQAYTLPVVDVAAIAQFVQQLEAQAQDYANQVLQYENQIRQIYNQYDQLKYAYETVKHGVQNLQQFELQYMTSPSELWGLLQSKLSQAKQIGYTVDRVVGQAQRIYPTVTTAMTPQAVRSAERLWSANKREAAQVALQTQAIQREQQEALRRVAELMQRSTQIQGTRDGLQAQCCKVRGSRPPPWPGSRSRWPRRRASRHCRCWKPPPYKRPPVRRWTRPVSLLICPPRPGAGCYR